MIIDVSNAEIINTKEVYIHDDIFEELWFNREGKQLHLLILKTEVYKSYTIDFFHIIGFEMTACDFGGILLIFWTLSMLNEKTTRLYQNYLRKRIRIVLIAHYEIKKII